MGLEQTTQWLVIGQAWAQWWGRMGDAAALAVVGMLVVFFALCLTAVAIVLLGRTLGLAPEEPAGPPAPMRRSTKGDAHLRVVLAAAATAALDRSVRVKRVRPSDPGQRTGSASG